MNVRARRLACKNSREASHDHVQPSELRNHVLILNPCFKAKGLLHNAAPSSPLPLQCKGCNLHPPLMGSNPACAALAYLHSFTVVTITYNHNTQYTINVHNYIYICLANCTLKIVYCGWQAYIRCVDGSTRYTVNGCAYAPRFTLPLLRPSARWVTMTKRGIGGCGLYGVSYMFEGRLLLVVGVV